MAKILQKYIKFSTSELEEYAANPESCVRCVKTDLHLGMGAYGMANFKHALHELLVRTKVGIYDANVNGIVLGIKNIKASGRCGAPWRCPAHIQASNQCHHLQSVQHNHSIYE
ncbi:uncharacterized protein Polr1F isoform X2 [Drosophila virilis]|uniref:uncharacterized protein Polr1F isoform X2 n=1 Tax=Drosophila virilis TaxID=7244 RepID=UPI0038B3AD43